MDDNKRMAALQSKGSGAPPAEPPMAPPGMGDAPQGGAGMPPPEQLIPQVADLLKQVADQIPDADKKSMVMSAAEQLQAVFPSKPQSGSSDTGMDDSTSEAGGTPTPGM